MDEKALTSSQAAEILGVKARTVIRWADAGHLPHWKTPSGQRRFDKEKLTEWLAKRQQTAKS